MPVYARIPFTMPHEPKKKRAKANKRTRRAAITLDAVKLVICQNCNAKTLAHMVCRSCGFYAGKKVNDNTQVKITKA